MDADKRKALEAAGWKFGDAADFLEMTYEERQLLDARVEMALAIPRLRAQLNLSQKSWRVGSRQASRVLQRSNAQLRTFR